MRPGEEHQEVLTLERVTLKEGEMWGRSVTNLLKWVDGNGRLVMKFLIYYLSF